MYNSDIYKSNETASLVMPACIVFNPGIRYDKFMDAMGGISVNPTIPTELRGGKTCDAVSVNFGENPSQSRIL